MTETPEDTGLPSRSHNNPPEILPVLPPEAVDAEREQKALDAAREATAEDENPAYDLAKWAALAANTEAFCDAAGEWKRLKRIGSAAQSERLTDFVDGARKLHKAVDEARKAEKAPWDAGAQKVQDAFSPLLAKLKTVGDSMKAMQADWLAREQARIEAERRARAEEAARARAEAEREAAQAAARGDISAQVDAEKAIKDAEKDQKAAARQAKARASSATGGGRAMALRKIRSARIVNLRACFVRFQTDPAVVEALQRAANAAVRAGMSEDDAKLAGIDIVETETAA